MHVASGYRFGNITRMELQFTPGAERAIRSASEWSDCSDSPQISAQSLLLGLLAETECRAAITLEIFQIDTPAILAKWPRFAAPNPDEIRDKESGENLRTARTEADQPVPVERFSADVKVSFAATLELLEDLPTPLILATEHLLLGLTAADHEVAAWLRLLGLDPRALAEEIHQQYGISPEPLPLDDLEPLEIGQTDVAVDAPADPPSNGPTSTEPHPSDNSAWSKKGSGTVVRSTLRAVPATVPDPFLNHAEDSDQSIGVSRQERIRLLRVIDAAANRAREGLRAVEDYVRFVLDDPHLTDSLKRLRHELTSVLSAVPLNERLAARETLADVGTCLATPSENRRQDATSVMVANFTRVQEALRSLEEFGKVLDPNMANELKQIRYDAYTLQRTVETTRSNAQMLADARLYVIIDGCRSARHFRKLVASLVTAGVDVIQLRDKRLDERSLLERARVLRETTLSTGTLFVMNDRADLAVLARADGVHVGQDDLAVKDARTLVGPGALVGVSTHSIEQARQAIMDGADYIGVGPTFPSGTKQFESYPGVKLLGAVASEIRLPAFAIGGISRENVGDVLSTGISRIAVSGAVAKSHDPEAAARELAAALASP